MKLTRIQKIAIAIFVASLLPATLIANWRYNSKLDSITGLFAKEQALHQSTDKLLINCDKIASTKANPYDATHQICDQGSDIHAQTEHAMALLTQEYASNQTKWYRNFALTVLLFNLLAFFLYRASIYLKREAD
jgi:acyl-homoserine lactone acylase PvdQ